MNKQKLKEELDNLYFNWDALYLSEQDDLIDLIELLIEQAYKEGLEEGRRQGE